MSLSRITPSKGALRGGAVALGASALIALGATAALAGYTSYTAWGTIGGSGTGQAYGNIQNENYSNLYVGSYHRSVNTGKYNYVEVWPTWYFPGGSYSVAGAQETARTSSSSYQWHVLRFALHPDGVKVRANIQTCYDISFQPDSCSADAYPTFSY